MSWDPMTPRLKDSLVCAVWEVGYFSCLQLCCLACDWQSPCMHLEQPGTVSTTSVCLVAALEEDVGFHLMSPTMHIYLANVKFTPCGASAFLFMYTIGFGFGANRILFQEV